MEGIQDEKRGKEKIEENKPNWTDNQYRLREFALDEYLQLLTSRKNCISVLTKLKFARFTAIPEFGRLVTYVAKYPEPGKTQLASLLFPTFVHLYILLLQISRDTSEALAEKFHASYASIFYKAEGYEKILAELKSLKDIKDVMKHPFFKNFREQKCVFGISVDVFKDLVSFINKMNSSALLYVFHLHFHFEDENIIDHNICNDCMDVVDTPGVDSRTGSSEDSNESPQEIIYVESGVSEVSKRKDDKAESAKATLSAYHKGIKNSPDVDSCTKSIEDSKESPQEIIYVESGVSEVSKRKDDKAESAKTTLSAYHKGIKNSLDVDSCTKSIEGSKESPQEIIDVESGVSEVSKRKESAKATLSEYHTRVKNSGSTLNLHCISLCSSDDDVFCSLDFATDEFQFYVSSEKKKLLCIKLENDPEIRPKNDIEVSMEDYSTIYDLNGIVSAIKYLPHRPDELLMAVGKTVIWYSFALNKEILVYEAAHDGKILDIDINSSATFFVTVSEDATACLFNFKSKKAVRRYIGHMKNINAVKFHPIRDYFVTGSSDFTVRLWTVEKDLTLRSFIGHTDEIFSVACANNGKILASADIVSVVRVWDIEKNCELFKLFCNESECVENAVVTSLCFKDDSSSLLACNAKGIVKEWNVREPFYQNMVYIAGVPLMVKYNNKYHVWVVVVNKSLLKK